jgi:hypothetical protein
MQVRQSGGAEGSNMAEFLTLELFLSSMQSSLTGKHGLYPVCDRVRYERFVGMLPTLSLGNQRLHLDTRVVWTHIRSFIKGSIEAVKAGRPLTLNEYLALAPERCRLTPDQRGEAYSVFEVYEGQLARSRLWDESGRTLDALSLWLRDRDGLPFSAGCPVTPSQYDRVYVDEVQDCTQAEIALFFVAVGMDTQALFLAGDPAQAVADGVDFRFEEVRAVVYSLSNGRERLDRPVKLEVNYRSHAGILNCASGILSKMFVLFPGSAKVLQPDRGLFTGPLPAFWLTSRLQNNSLLQVLSAVPNSERLVLVCPDERREGLALLCHDHLVFGIKEAKGLEFHHVAVVDFFCGLSSRDQAAWVRILGEDKGIAVSAARDNPQVESQLKLLYTAVTRTSRSLIFVETVKSVAGAAFCQWLKKTRLGEPLAVPDCESALDGSVRQMPMGSGELLALGLNLAVSAESEELLAFSQSLLAKAAQCFARAGAVLMNSSVDLLL